MDALSTPQDRVAKHSWSALQTESLERLIYVARSGQCGLLTGASGTGKSLLLAEAARRLRRSGVRSTIINLRGTSPRELPFLLAGRLGLGLEPQGDLVALWSKLQDHAESTRRISRKMAILCDQLDESCESLEPALSRLMDLYSGSCGWLFATTGACGGQMGRMLRERVWLRIETGELTATETARVLMRELQQQGAGFRFTPQAIEAAKRLTSGNPRAVVHLGRLAAVAGLSDQSQQFTAEDIRDLADELA